MPALEFREILKRPGPSDYELCAFDSSFGLNDATGHVYEPFLTDHKRCVGVVRLGSGPEDLDAPRAKRVIEKGAKGLADRWRPFCLNPGHYEKPDLWAGFSPPQAKRGSRFAIKALQAKERDSSLSQQYSTSKPANSGVERVGEHAIYDTDRSVTCNAPTKGGTENSSSIRSAFTSQSKKAANASGNQVRRKNAVLLDVSPDGPAVTGPDVQRALSGLQMGRQHLLIHALIKDMEEMQAEKRRKRLEKQLQQDAGVRIGEESGEAEVAASG